MRENMMKEDMMSSDMEIEESAGPIKGKDKGTMNFPKERARVAQKIMSQQKFKGLPKRWKGRGDYFFETQDDGTIKVTGGDKSSSLTGGKSTIVKDRERIQKIIEAARGGDVIEENVSYKMSEEAGPSFESRGGGSAGLEYLNETDQDAEMGDLRSALSPEATQVDSPIKFAEARRTHKEILSEIEQVDREAFKAAMSTNPQMKFLKEKVDELASMGNAAGARMLAELLANEFKKDQGEFKKDEQTRETISNMRSE